MELQPQRILVAITGTVEGQRALEHGIQLARMSGADLVGLVIEARLPAAPATVAEVEDARRAGEPFFDTITTLAIDQAAEHGINLQIRRRPGPLVRAVCREARTSDVNLVIIGRPRSILGLPRIASLTRRLRRPLLLTP
jgi:nucleotide-binding universal stress UspA family protein